MVRAALNEAYFLTLPDVDQLSPRVLSTDEQRFRSVRYFQDPESKVWTRFEPWMTTIVDLDTGQVVGVVDGRDHRGVGEWLFARPLAWRRPCGRGGRPFGGVPQGATDVASPDRCCRRSLPPDLPGQPVRDRARQNLSQQVKGRRGRAVDKAWAHPMRLLRAGDSLTEKAAHPLAEVFADDDPTSTLQAVWRVKE